MRTAPPNPPSPPEAPGELDGNPLEGHVVAHELSSLAQAAEQVRTGGDVAAVAAAYGLPATMSPVAVEEALTRKAGALVAARAEAIAGINVEEVRDSWNQRMEELRADMLDAAKYQEIEDERGVPELREAVWEAHNAVTRAVEERRDPEEVSKLEDEYHELLTELDTTLDELASDHPGFVSPSGLEELYATTSVGQDPETVAHLNALAEGYRKVLAEHRQLGGELAVQADDDKARALLDAASAVFPADWIAASNAHGPVRATFDKAQAGHYTPAVRAGTVVERKVQTTEVVPAGGQVDWGMPERGVYLDIADAERDYRLAGVNPDGSKEYLVTHYEVATGAKQPDGSGWRRVRYLEGGRTATGWRRPRVEARPLEHDVPATICLSGAPAPLGEDGTRTALHELAHRFEDTIPELGTLGQEFLKRRTTNPDGTRQQPVALRGDTEALTRPDSFVDAAVGRVYEDRRFTEVFTTGVEALFTGAHGGLLGVASGQSAREDLDHRAFVLGVLATVRPKQS